MFQLGDPLKISLMILFLSFIFSFFPPFSNYFFNIKIMCILGKYNMEKKQDRSHLICYGPKLRHLRYNSFRYVFVFLIYLDHTEDDEANFLT